MGIWSFRSDRGELTATLVGVPGEKRLLPISDGAFATGNGSFVAKFDASADSVSITEYHAPPIVFSRTTLAPPRNPHEYVGTYSTDELPAVYRFEVSSGRLTVTQPKVAAGTLSPTILDGFTGTGNYFLFRRDSSGKITEVRLGENTGRVRNIELERTSTQ